MPSGYRDIAAVRQQAGARLQRSFGRRLPPPPPVYLYDVAWPWGPVDGCYSRFHSRFGSIVKQQMMCKCYGFFIFCFISNFVNFIETYFYIIKDLMNIFKIFGYLPKSIAVSFEIYHTAFQTRCTKTFSMYTKTFQNRKNKESFSETLKLRSHSSKRVLNTMMLSECTVIPFHC